MVNVLPAATLSNLIGSIYDCALDPSRWEGTLDDIRSVLECETAVLGLLDVPHNRFLITRTVGMDQHMLELLAKGAHELQTFLSDHVQSITSLDEPFVVSRWLSRAYVEASPHFQRARAYGIIDMIEYHLVHSPTRIADVGFGRHERQGVITDREIEIGGLLLPHIRRAVTISNVLDIHTIERARMAEALDALRCAVLLVDARGAILHTNTAAERMLRDGGLIQDAGGILRATSAAAAAELRAAIGLGTKDEASIGRTGLGIRLTESGMPPLFAHVLPLTGSDFRTRLQPSAVAAVFIGATPDERDTVDNMAAAFSLTPAETRVLASLLAGRTLAETAAALGIAGTTAKTHLENIFSKTGVSRQAELMRLAARLLPPTRSES